MICIVPISSGRWLTCGEVFDALMTSKTKYAFKIMLPRNRHLVGELSNSHIEVLWKLFLGIHEVWGNEACKPEDMASRWREFIKVKTNSDPSYLFEYQEACNLLNQLEPVHGSKIYDHIFFELRPQGESPIARFKTLVVDEFIRVYISSGGFRCFGGANYGGFVSGSRYRTIPPYRIAKGQE